MQDDRGVELKGDSLAGRKFEFIVTGGIGAIESPKIIRELRRYGAEVRVWMTAAAQEFVRPRVFEWASRNEVLTDLSGSAEHISFADAAIVVPCTLDFMSKLSLGLADSASLTCLQSMLGRKPVLLLPSMHESLAESPAYAQSLRRLKEIPSLNLLRAQREEGKLKVASPEEIVGEVCHQVSSHYFPKRREKKILVLAGPTRSYLDDVRYLSNYSTGELGIKVAERFFRNGFQVFLLAGPLTYPLPAYLDHELVDRATTYHTRALEILKSEEYFAAVHAVAMLDFEIESPYSNKVSSAEKLQISLRPRPKLIEEVRPLVKQLVGFKLQSGLSDEAMIESLQEWNCHKSCDLVVGNRREDIQSKYRAFLLGSNSGWLSSKEEVVDRIYQFLAEKI